MTLTLTPTNLEENGYQLHERLDHADLVNFIKRYFFLKNPVIVFYWIFNVVVLATGILFLVLSDIPAQAIGKFFLGFFFFLFLIPIHELIHGIGYKLSGADRVSYKAEWKKLVFYAMADGFVVNRIQFVSLAIAPFLILNSVLIVTCFFVPEIWGWFCYGLLVMHIAGCSGDFALISYFYTYWEKEPVTFDDVSGKVSFFFLKNA